DRPAPAGGSPPPRLRIASRSAPPGDRDGLGHHQRGGVGAADARFRTPRRSKYFSKLSASTEPKTWISVATSPVQPVWWLAPHPAPWSPWKHSKNSKPSRQGGSDWNFSAPPKTGRAPFSSRTKMFTSRREISPATSKRFMKTPEPVGHSTV